MPPTREALREAIDDYVEQANDNERVRRTLRTWRCVIHLNATDADATFTMTVEGGQVADVADGLQGPPDLIVHGTGDDLNDIFWGDVNPAERYNQGALRIEGPQEHLMRLDAMAMLIFLG